MDLAARNGLSIAAAGSASVLVLDRPGDHAARALHRRARKTCRTWPSELLIFGTHVHIGIEDPEFLIDAMNVVAATSCRTCSRSRTSSPFWMGRNTGLKSYRSIVFRNFPRTGIPPHAGSWAEFEELVDVLVDTKSIPNATKIWWDVRPQLELPDARVPHLRRLHPGRRGGLHRGDLPGHHRQALEAAPRQPDLPASIPLALIEENKWRAVRYGLDGKLIDFGKQRASCRRAT